MYTTTKPGTYYHIHIFISLYSLTDPTCWFLAIKKFPPLTGLVGFLLPLLQSLSCLRLWRQIRGDPLRHLIERDSSYLSRRYLRNFTPERWASKAFRRVGDVKAFSIVAHDEWFGQIDAVEHLTRHAPHVPHCHRRAVSHSARTPIGKEIQH